MTEHGFSTNSGWTVATVRIDSSTVHSHGGPEYPRIVVPVEFRFYPIHAQGSQLTHTLLFLALHGQMFLPQGQRFGDVVSKPINLLVERETPPSPIEIEILLDLYRAEKLEEVRKGDAEFRLDLQLSYLTFRRVSLDNPTTLEGYSTGPFETGVSRQTVWIRIPQSVWVNNVLPGLGLGQVKLVEISLASVSACEPLRDSFQALDKALSQFRLGFYDEAAGSCRLALEPFFDLEEKPDGSGKRPILKKTWEKKLGTATYNWLDGSLGAIKFASNPVHHSASARFGRFDAQMLIAITTAVIAYVVRSIERDQSIGLVQ